MQNMFNKNRPAIIMAPMAGITDSAFRKLCLHYGADLVVTEMVSAKALSFSDKKSYQLAQLYDGDRPAVIQIFGSDPKSIAFAAKEVSQFAPVAIDINMGCPVPKISGSGDGVGLMRKPELVGEIVSAALAATDIPITVKIRSGWDANSINAVEIATIAERSGAAAVTVHGRTKVQGYEGKADRDVIKSVKQALSIPVIANGDVFNGDSAFQAIAHTGCDGVMVGRGALGAPWVFADIVATLEGKTAKVVTDEEKRTVMLWHLEMMVADKGEASALFEIRKHIAWYIKGIPNAAALRASVFAVNSSKELEKIIKSLY